MQLLSNRFFVLYCSPFRRHYYNKTWQRGSHLFFCMLLETNSSYLAPNSTSFLSLQEDSLEYLFKILLSPCLLNIFSNDFSDTACNRYFISSTHL